MKSIGEVKTQFHTFGTPDQPFTLESGQTLDQVTIAYETYGTLNEDRSNAILVCHSLTGSAHAAGYNTFENYPDDSALDASIWTEDCREGWWDTFIGPGKIFDTNRFFVLSTNYIGSCYGSTGPASINPRTGKPYGGHFPDVTIGDMVRAQNHILDHLGIETLLAAAGGSMGGMIAMDLALRCPERVRVVIPLASSATTSVLTKVHNFEQLYALQEDPDYNYGNYYDGQRPYQGLVLARMIGHKTFVSLDVLQERARDCIVQNDNDLKGYRMRHQIESYMLHQGKKFATRFDANSYVRILTAWQQFDLARTHGGGSLTRAFKASANHQYLVMSIDSDACFYPDEQADIVRALKTAGVHHRYITVHSDKGHDSFLIEPELYAPCIVYTLNKEIERNHHT